MAKTAGLLALQGAFREHGQKMAALGFNIREIRQKKDLHNIDGLILPGGESTTIGKLLVDLDMLDPLKDLITQGMPAFGTCAGAILLCKKITGSDQPRIGLLDVEIERNAFGRQNESFEQDLQISALGQPDFPAVFIRAPLMALPDNESVKVLASLSIDGKSRPVAVRQNNMLAISFHPELTKDNRFHEYFGQMLV